MQSEGTSSTLEQLASNRTIKHLPAYGTLALLLPVHYFQKRCMYLETYPIARYKY